MSSNAVFYLAAIGILISFGLMASSDPEKDQMGRYLFIGGCAVMVAVKLIGGG